MVTLADLLENKVLGPVLRKRFADGQLEGQRKGERKGERKLLLLQIERRFGPLSPEQHRRVNRASEQQIMQWAVDLLSASSIEALLG